METGEAQGMIFEFEESPSERGSFRPMTKGYRLEFQSERLPDVLRRAEDSGFHPVGILNTYLGRRNGHIKLKDRAGNTARIDSIAEPDPRVESRSGSSLADLVEGLERDGYRAGRLRQAGRFEGQLELFQGGTYAGEIKSSELDGSWVFVARLNHGGIRALYRLFVPSYMPSLEAHSEGR